MFECVLNPNNLILPVFFICSAQSRTPVIWLKSLIPWVKKAST
jgi:hypothetical protein